MIKENIRKIKSEIPDNVTLLLAAKKRSINEIKEAISSGIKVFGENYVQEAEEKYKGIDAELHLIGHLQSNKVKKAVEIFDMIQTVDSEKLAVEIDMECRKANKIMPVMVEVNIGKEENKSGCMPEKVMDLAEKISSLPNLKLKGLMTMAPYYINAEKTRPFFRETKLLFDEMKEKYSVEILSMGMSHSYKIAIEEGATLVRIGTKIFGER